MIIISGYDRVNILITHSWLEVHVHVELFSVGRAHIIFNIKRTKQPDMCLETHMHVKEA